MCDYVHNHALQASLRVCHVNDMIQPMGNIRMSHAVPYTARCLSLFNLLWEGEGGGEENWYLCASLPDLGLWG